jgi:ADP-ribose pyrophosphatase YjhB (NUDIX family)
MTTPPPRRIYNYDNMSESKIIASLKEVDKLYTNTISACGILFYKNTDNGKELLLMKYADPNWNKLDDFGGCIDASDSSVIEAIVRETREESNGKITREMVESVINDNNYTVFYNNYSKYYSIVVEVDSTFFPDTSVFGDFEESDQIYRTIGWYNYNDCKESVACRLSKNSDTIAFLENSYNGNLT